MRSHEVKDEGYEIEHDGKLITVFSAPNYCDQVLSFIHLWWFAIHSLPMVLGKNSLYVDSPFSFQNQVLSCIFLLKLYQ